MNISRSLSPDRICTLTFDREGSSANLFDRATLLELEGHLDELDRDDALCGVIVATAKPKIFIAGADLNAFAKNADEHALGEMVDLGHRIFTRLSRLRVPSVAAIHGTCLGGGLELALACDWRVATTDKATKLGLPETPILFLEFHGTDASVAEQSQRFGEIAAEFGGGPFTWTTRPEERTRLWEARHQAAMSCLALRPGSALVATDVCVPISRLADCVTETQADIAASRLLAPIVGHIGDGNFHLSLLVDTKDADEVARAKALSERLVERALAMDGTCTGEHGVGQGKMKYLLAEHGPAALAAMAAIKTALDPQNLMNPGKIVAI